MKTRPKFIRSKRHPELIATEESRHHWKLRELKPRSVVPDGVKITKVIFFYL